MQLLGQDNKTYTLQLSHEEAATFSNALNEALESLDAWEFETRLGATQEEVAKLLDAFSQIFAS